MKPQPLNVRRSILAKLFKQGTVIQKDNRISFESDDETPDTQLLDDDIAQMDTFLMETITQTELQMRNDQDLKAAGIDFSEQVTRGYNIEKIITILRNSNITNIQNLHTKYKGIVKNIIENKIGKLQVQFKQEIGLIMKQLLNIKSALHEKEVKLRQTEFLLSEQELQMKQSREGREHNFRRVSKLKDLELQAGQINQRNYELESELRQLKADLEKLNNANLDSKTEYMKLQREMERQRKEQNQRIEELEKKLQGQMQMRKLDRESVKKMSSQLQQHLNLSEQYIDSKLSLLLPNDVSEITLPSSNDASNLNLYKIEQYQKEIGKLRRENEALRKYKTDDQIQKQKSLQQSKELNEMQLRIEKLQNDYQSAIQIIEQQGRSFTSSPSKLHDFLLYPPHLSTTQTNVDHYYQSPHRFRYPSFDLKQVRLTTEEQLNLSGSRDDNTKVQAIRKIAYKQQLLNYVTKFKPSTPTHEYKLKLNSSNNETETEQDIPLKSKGVSTKKRNSKNTPLKKLDSK